MRRDVAVPIGVGLSGLTSDTTYHVRLVASNAAGIGRSADRTLRTTRPAQPLAPLATTTGLRDLAARSVTVTGSVNPRGAAARYQFDYGTGSNLNRRTALVAAGAGTAAVAASATLTVGRLDLCDHDRGPPVGRGLPRDRDAARRQRPRARHEPDAERARLARR